MTHVHVGSQPAASSTRYDIANRLRALADHISNTIDDYNGSCTIIILRRKG